MGRRGAWGLVVLAWLGMAGGVWAEEAPAAPPTRESPRLLNFVEARYPERAKQERLEARVPLRIRLDEEGRVTEAEVVESIGHGFDEAAREAVLEMRFSPAKRDGKAKPSRLVYTYVFRLPEEAPRAAAPPPPPPVPVPGPDDVIEVLVQGPSLARQRRQSAEAVQVVETETIQREAADLGEALARSEGVGVRRSGGLGSRSRFSLAGLTDEQIRFFVDGVPLDLAGFGPELSNVPVNLVQRVELYQGVVPIRFGTDALGGAVHLVTDQQVNPGTGAAASYELGSFDTHRLTATARHLHEPSGLFVRANGFIDSTRNDYPIDVKVANDLGKSVPARIYRFNDAYRAWGAGVEAGFVDKPWAQRLLLRAFVNGSDKEIQNNVFMTQPYGEVTSGEFSAGSILRYEHFFGPGVTADGIVGYNFRRTHFEDLGTCAYDWFGRCVTQLPQPGEIESRAVERGVNQHTGFARLNLGWTLSSGHRLRVSLAPTVIGRTGGDSQLRARGELDPLSADRQLTSLVTGVEYTFNALEERLENVLFLKDYYQRAQTQKLLPSLVFVPLDRTLHGVGVGDSVRFRLLPELYAKASYEYATRLPRPDEIFGDGILIDDNLDLNPERSHNLNVEFSYEGLPTRAGAFRANVLGFGRLADQLILLLGKDSYFTYQNVYAARSLGVAGAAGWTSPGQYLSLDGNITWQDFRNTSREGDFATFLGQRIPNRPYLQANGTARFQLSGVMSARDELSLTWHARYIHAFFRAWEKAGTVDSKQVIDSQLLHSLALSYVTRRENLTFGWTVDVQNLTDTPAYDFFGVQRPGRSVFAKLIVEH
ncbi:TonB-dependent siderophore myxochelin receptor MxcH [Melittangium boletus]|uniref:TonB-dependent siderophore myxochelin receptor MxcH n=1 Tax=Melittangium boletus TaxID=83453 RepID=UPI001FECF9BD|nr:TonB-dependent siderophore myxochelin receptor MxcH [Melittangium boletus]